MRGSGKGGRAGSFPDPPRFRSRLDSLAFSTRRCFRSLPPIESLEQAKRNEDRAGWKRLKRIADDELKKLSWNNKTRAFTTAHHNKRRQQR